MPDMRHDVFPLIPILLAGFLLWGCTPHFGTPGHMTAEPRLTENHFISFDGEHLPLRQWVPPGRLRAVIIALHGYNDYSAFIKDTAASFNQHGIGIYAYDQRGFGAAPNSGRWGGQQAMCRDLRTIIALLQKRHPDIPIFLLGDSMGGAVIMAAHTPDNPLPGEGVILVAPAVWARSTMPWYQRWTLGTAVRLVPWLRVSPEGLHVTPSDNIPMLKELGRDPLVLKESRIDALYGLSNLMDAAYAASSRFNKRTLFLYGARDEIIPPRPMADVFRERLHGTFSEPQRILCYENGYHMLLRDLQAEVVRRDILTWLDTPGGTFPSVLNHTAWEIQKEQDIERIIGHQENKGKTS